MKTVTNGVVKRVIVVATQYFRISVSSRITAARIIYSEVKENLYFWFCVSSTRNQYRDKNCRNIKH